MDRQGHEADLSLRLVRFGEAASSARAAAEDAVSSMSGADWVALVAGIVLGGAIGAPLGFYFGRRNVAAATVMASQAAQVKAELTASSERDQINAAAAALQAKIPAEAPEQAVNDLENLP